MQKLNKSTALLQKISTRDIFPESRVLEDPGLLELFSWHTSRSPRARLKDTLKLLVKNGYISEGQLNQEALYSLTPKGSERLVNSEHKRTPPLPQKWDRRWHFVTYQIPNARKVTRNSFILELKRLGFVRYGPALWIFPHDLSSHLKKIALHSKISEYVEYIRADTISNQKAWLKKFKL